MWCLSCGAQMWPWRRVISPSSLCCGMMSSCIFTQVLLHHTVGLLLAHAAWVVFPEDKERGTIAQDYILHEWWVVSVGNYPMSWVITHYTWVMGCFQSNSSPKVLSCLKISKKWNGMKSETVRPIEINIVLPLPSEAVNKAWSPI